NSDYPGLAGPVVPAQPAWEAYYVPERDVRADPSDADIALPGSATLKVVFQHTAMHGEDGKDSLLQPAPKDPALAFGGDFEGSVTWYIGADELRPFRVLSLGDGAVAVDVVRA